MKLVRYNNFDNYAPTKWNSLLDTFFTDANLGGARANKFIPSVDILENDNAYEILVAVPGMNKEDFHIDINERQLIVSGERKWKDESKDQNYHKVETQFGSFSRTFTLPDNVNKEKIGASYNNGILEIEIPKDEKKTLKTAIKVK